MEIRVLTPTDAAAQWTLRQEALEHTPEAFSSAAEEHRATTVEEAAQRIGADSENFIVGAFVDGELVGTAGFYRERGSKTRHKGHVWGVYVTPRARGRGVGRTMMQALLERAAAIDGVEQVVLSVTTTMAAAIRLYQSFGFQSFGCEPKALKLGGKYADTEYMLLELSRVTAEHRGGG